MGDDNATKKKAAKQHWRDWGEVGDALHGQQKDGEHKIDMVRTLHEGVVSFCEFLTILENELGPFIPS